MVRFDHVEICRNAQDDLLVAEVSWSIYMACFYMFRKSVMTQAAVKTKGVDSAWVAPLHLVLKASCFYLNDLLHKS